MSFLNYVKQRIQEKPKDTYILYSDPKARIRLEYNTN